MEKEKKYNFIYVEVDKYANNYGKTFFHYQGKCFINQINVAKIYKTRNEAEQNIQNIKNLDEYGDYTTFYFNQYSHSLDEHDPSEFNAWEKDTFKVLSLDEEEYENYHLMKNIIR